MPLSVAGIRKLDVREFWGGQSFDLQLQQHEGNCDACFLKGAGKVLEIFRRRPDDATWWIEQEASPTRDGMPATFVKPGKRPNYAGLLWIARHQQELEITPAMLEADDDSQECHCHD